MTEPNLDHCYRALELAPGASLTEVKNSYLRLKRLYAEDSALLQMVSADFPKERRAAILAEVEAAYRQILASFKVPLESRPTPAEAASARSALPTGAGLRQWRESRGLSLQGIQQVTKIRVEILENIEAENFEALHDASFIRNHLTQYARSLGIDPNTVLDGYLERYEEWLRRRARTFGSDT